MPDSDPPRSQPIPSKQLKGSTIVVADDDRITRELLAETLRAHGFVVEAVPDGQAAVDQITKSLVNKILHSPIEQLKQLAHDPEGPDIAELIRKIFNIKAQ